MCNEKKQPMRAQHQVTSPFRSPNFTFDVKLQLPFMLRFIYFSPLFCIFLVVIQSSY